VDRAEILIRFHQEIRVKFCLFLFIDSIEKTTLVQFANEAVIDKIIDIDLADARILCFQQALYIAHSFDRRGLRAMVHELPQRFML
jgi:hypothetical protein